MLLPLIRGLVVALISPGTSVPRTVSSNQTVKVYLDKLVCQEIFRYNGTPKAIFANRPLK